MKLEVEPNMYVRTKTGIKRIYTIDNNKTKYKYLYKLKKQDGDGCIDCGALSSEDILKASHNIIDLIEENDLVEIEYLSLRFEERITRIFEVDYKYGKSIHFGNHHCDLHIHDGNWSNEDEELEPIIKSIVTREQFEAMAYKVVE